MKYTLRRGVERRFSEKFRSNFRFILPLLAIFALAIFWGLGSHSPKKKQGPLVLGIYTIKSHDKSSGNKGSNNKSSNQPPDNPGAASPMASGLASAAGIGGGGGGNLQGGALGGTYSTASGSTSTVQGTSPTLTGGMGGGGTGTPSGGTTSGSTPTGSTPTTSTSTPVGTVMCTDLGTLAQLCTACTNPILLQPGQKAILQADGTCVAVN